MTVRDSSKGSWTGLIRTIISAAMLLGLGIAVEVFFLTTERGQRFYSSTFGAVVALRELVGVWADRLRVVLPGLAAISALVVLVIAVARGRWRAAIAPAALVLLTLVMSTALKDFVVSRPYLGDFGYAENTFPSGHTAVTVAVLVAFFWLLPRLHPLVAIPLTGFSSTAALFQVASYAHRLSDVIGGALLVAMIAVFLIGPVGALSARLRWGFWIGVVLAAVIGALCLMSWESSGYAYSQQWTATAGIALTAGASAGVAFTIAAERPIGARGRRG
jgi:membrane-associated phospholipid phosphatase